MSYQRFTPVTAAAIAVVTGIIAFAIVILTFSVPELGSLGIIVEVFAAGIVGIVVTTITFVTQAVVMVEHTNRGLD